MSDNPPDPLAGTGSDTGPNTGSDTGPDTRPDKRQRPRLRRPLLVLLLALAVVVVAVAAVRVVETVSEARRSELVSAVRLAPPDAVRFSWTDWAGVRDELGVSLPSPSSTRDVGRLLSRAFDADLSATSALVGSAAVAEAELGFSPASATWELFSQGEDGAMITLRMPESTDFDQIADQLRRQGFTEPAEPDGVWLGGADLLSGVGAQLTPELQFVALDAEQRLVRTSDQQPYLAAQVERIRETGGESELADGLDDVTDAIGSPLAAAVYDGDQACSSLAMASAAEEDQQVARDLVARAGEVNPVTAFAMGVQPGGAVSVELGFENDDQARRNADSRAELATGPAPGQGGTFADRFALVEARAEGRVVTLDLAPVDGAFVLSDLSTGPVLFATC